MNLMKLLGQKFTGCFRISVKKTSKYCFLVKKGKKSLKGQFGTRLFRRYSEKYVFFSFTCV